MNGLTESIVINASQEKVFKVISDFESYPEFLPEIEEVQIEKKTAKQVIAKFTLNLMKRISYRMKMKINKPDGISWELIDGDILTQNNGSWKLKKISTRKTEAIYSIDVKFGSFVPSFISNMLINNTLPQMLENFKDRIENG